LGHDDDGQQAAGATPGDAARAPLERGRLAWIVGPIIVLVIMSNVGNALFPQLSTDNPLLLIALSAPNRNLIIASHHAPLVAYYLVGFARLLAPDWFFYALGEHYGERAITWMEQRTPTFGALMRQLESLFGRFGHALVLILPNNPICLLAGAARMPKKVFWSLNVGGTIGRLVLMWWIGDLFQAPIDAILDFIGAHRTPLLVATIAIVALSMLREWRAGSSEIRQLIDLEEDLAGGD
jgi:membrane protein DedA with SNARE-associated domain